MSVRIVIDSATDIDQEKAAEFDVVHMQVRFGEEEFIDGVNLDQKTFYDKLIESDVLPTTSQATPIQFTEVLDRIVEAGDTAVVLTLSSKLSGTYQSAMLAARDYEEGSVYVVDTLNVAIGSGVLAMYALSLRDEGKSAKEIAEEIEKRKGDVCLVALLDTLEYLKKGGRISSAVAFAGGLLSIKPVVAIVDGAVELLGKARGSKQGNNLLMEEIAKAGGIDYKMPVMLGYTGMGEQLLEKYVADSSSLWEGRVEKLPISYICSVVGTHIGPGAIAVAFIASK